MAPAVLLLLALLFVAGCGKGGETISMRVGPRWSLDGTQIFFASVPCRYVGDDVSCNSELYVMDAGGSGQERLTRIAGTPDGSPDPSQLPVALSADGARIAYAFSSRGPTHIVVKNADGSGQENLTDGEAIDWAPVWSPDGSRIAFASAEGGSQQVVVISADGSGRTPLGDAYVGVESWAWSPDGGRIAFSALPEGAAATEVFVVNADGSALINMTNSPGYDSLPTWSPDGRRIAFTSDAGMYITDVDRPAVTLLTDQPDLGGSRSLAWSPDGSRLAFVTYADHAGGGVYQGVYDEIYVVAADGSGLTQLTHAGGQGPAWSPDGSSIAFVSDRSQTFEVYVMNADGSGQTRLTGSAAAD